MGHTTILLDYIIMHIAVLVNIQQTLGALKAFKFNNKNVLLFFMRKVQSQKLLNFNF